MPTGKKILNLNILSVIGAMKIPVGGTSKNAVSVDSLVDHINHTNNIYQTTSPAINSANGLFQSLTLTANGTLSSTIAVGELVLLRVSGAYTLNISAYKNVNNFTRDVNKKTFIALFNWDSQMLLFGFNYVE